MQPLQEGPGRLRGARWHSAVNTQCGIHPSLYAPHVRLSNDGAAPFVLQVTHWCTIIPLTDAIPLGFDLWRRFCRQRRPQPRLRHSARMPVSSLMSTLAPSCSRDSYPAGCITCAVGFSHLVHCQRVPPFLFLRSHGSLAFTAGIPQLLNLSLHCGVEVGVGGGSGSNACHVGDCGGCIPLLLGNDCCPLRCF